MTMRFPPTSQRTICFSENAGEADIPIKPTQHLYNTHDNQKLGSKHHTELVFSSHRRTENKENRRRDAVSLGSL